MSTWSSEFSLVCLNLNSEPRYLASSRWWSHPPVTEPKVDKGWWLIHRGADVFFPCYNHIMMIQNENLTCLLQAAENKCLTLPHQPTRAWNESRFNMIHNTNLHIFTANPPIVNSELRAIAAEPAARAWQDSFGWVEGWIWINNIPVHVMCKKMSKKVCSEIKNKFQPFFSCELEKSVWSQNESWRQNMSGLCPEQLQHQKWTELCTIWPPFLGFISILWTLVQPGWREQSLIHLAHKLRRQTNHERFYPNSVWG